LRPDGYPASLPQGQRVVMALALANSHYPIGRYTVSWDGKGRIGFPLSRVVLRDVEAQRMVVDVSDNRGPLNVAIDETQPADPVRNVRVLWPDTQTDRTSQPFNPAFLEKIAPFSLLRFMDWGGTNASPLVEWADRPRTGDLGYATAKGVPVERMVELANTLGADPWFCVPHQASDDYVRQFASLLHARLDPGLRPHIEYSNEVWNRGFAQSQWALAQAERLGLPRPLGLPSIFHARRSVEIFKLFAEVYGADRGRLIRVIAGHAAWTPFQESALAWEDTAAHTDVLAIAPYFKAEQPATRRTWRRRGRWQPERLLDQMLADIRGPVAAAIRANAALARKHGLRLLGYEGGAHDTATQFAPAHQAAMTTLFAAAHRHPRMREVYAEYFARWIEGGGETLVHYNDIGIWSKYGFWGSLEHLAQEPDDAPKYRALLDVIARYPRPSR
jgi:hypothetical protein